MTDRIKMNGGWLRSKPWSWPGWRPRRRKEIQYTSANRRSMMTKVAALEIEMGIQRTMSKARGTPLTHEIHSPLDSIRQSGQFHKPPKLNTRVAFARKAREGCRAEDPKARLRASWTRYVLRRARGREQLLGKPKPISLSSRPSHFDEPCAAIRVEG